MSKFTLNIINGKIYYSIFRTCILKKSFGYRIEQIVLDFIRGENSKFYFVNLKSYNL